MSISINLYEIENVLRQSPGKRYKYFLNKITDLNCIWGLYKEGWALAEDDEGITTIPLWPMKEYAELCVVDEWESYEARAMDLKYFIEVFLFDLESDRIIPCVFYTKENQSFCVDHKKLREDILIFLKKIE